MLHFTAYITDNVPSTTSSLPSTRTLKLYLCNVILQEKTILFTETFFFKEVYKCDTHVGHRDLDQMTLISL